MRSKAACPCYTQTLRAGRPKARCHGRPAGVQRETAVPSCFEKESELKHYTLRQLIFFALCCDLGLFSKKLIAPAANIITDSLHIPGGIGTSFSLLFLVLAAALIPRFGCAALMGAVQSGLAVAFGMVGSMGMLAPIGYILPGVAIDIVLWCGRKTGLPTSAAMMFANMLGAACASLTANLIVFHLPGIVLALYLAVALLTGALCGLAAGQLFGRLRPYFQGVRSVP